jgi:hypothetical protein
LRHFVHDLHGDRFRAHTDSSHKIQLGSNAVLIPTSSHPMYSDGLIRLGWRTRLSVVSCGR